MSYPYILLGVVPLYSIVYHTSVFYCVSNLCILLYVIPLYLLFVILLYSNVCHTSVFYCVPYHCILLYVIPLYSIVCHTSVFYCVSYLCILLYVIPLYSIVCHTSVFYVYHTSVFYCVSYLCILICATHNHNLWRCHQLDTEVWYVSLQQNLSLYACLPSNFSSKSGYRILLCLVSNETSSI